MMSVDVLYWKSSRRVADSRNTLLKFLNQGLSEVALRDLFCTSFSSEFEGGVGFGFRVHLDDDRVLWKTYLEIRFYIKSRCC